MAESQDLFSYDPAVLAALEKSISPARLRPYLKKSNQNQVEALKHYLWNARLAKSFLFPLQMVEITIRNSMHNAFTQQYRSEDWIFSPSFDLTVPGATSHGTAYTRLMRTNSTPSANDLVAALSFDFWSNLFRDEYEVLWVTPGLLRATFPLLPETLERGRIKHLVSRINKLRNRIAHHEPIHQMSLIGYLDDIQEILSYVCVNTQTWVETNSTVKQVLYSPPSPASTFVGAPLLLSKYTVPTVVNPSTTVMAALAFFQSENQRAALVPNPSRTPPFELITINMIATFIQFNALKAGGYVDLNGHNLLDVLATSNPIGLRSISVQSSTGDLKAIFYPRTQKGKKAKASTVTPTPPLAVLIMDPAKMPGIVGIVFRPDIKL